MQFECVTAYIPDYLRRYAGGYAITHRGSLPRLDPIANGQPKCYLETVWRYQNRAIEAAQVIAELIDLALVMRSAYKRGEDLGLTEDELATLRCFGSERSLCGHSVPSSSCCFGR